MSPITTILTEHITGWLVNALKWLNPAPSIYSCDRPPSSSFPMQNSIRRRSGTRGSRTQTTSLGAASGRSIGSQRTSGGFMVSGCDFAEVKETSHIARALSFERKPSVRSFRISTDRPITNYYDPKPPGQTNLKRTNAIKLSPLQYIRYVFAQMRMRMRLRRRSPVTFKQKTGTRKRKYLLEPTAFTYQYRIRTRDLFKRNPKVKKSGISGPVNVLHGPEALAVAEQGKNQKFNITTSNLHCSDPATISVPVRHKELPRRVSQRSPSTKSAVLPDPPNRYTRQGYPTSDLDEMEEAPELIPSKLRSTGPQTRTEVRRLDSVKDAGDEPVDIEDALDFVNAWGSYLQKILASRVIKEREARLQEIEEETRYINYEESDDSSIYSEDAHGVYDSCTSDCFARDSSPQTHRHTTDSESDVVQVPPAIAALVELEHSRQNPSPLPPMPPPHVPQSVRRVSGPRPMVPKDFPSEQVIPKDTVHPLQISPRRVQASASPTSAYFTPLLSVRRSHVDLGDQSETELAMTSASEDQRPISSTWVAKSASPMSKTSKRMSGHSTDSTTPTRYRHTQRPSGSSTESESAQLLGQYHHPPLRSSSESI